MKTKAMEMALEAGARRRALARLATPPPAASKRPHKKSPTTGSVPTETPDPKRHMSVVATDSNGTPSTSAASVATPPPPVAPVELFGDDVNPDPCGVDMVVDDTHMDDSPGWVTTSRAHCTWL